MFRQIFQNVCDALKLISVNNGESRSTTAKRNSRQPVRLSLTDLESRETPSLTLISNAGFPWSSIVKLEMTYSNGDRFVGTGAMIGTHHVLTCGHNLYNFQSGGWVSSVKVTPAMNVGSSSPYGVAYATQVRTYNSFMTFNRSNPRSTSPTIRDIGLITLDRQIGNRTGWMAYGYSNNNSTFASGRVFNTAGYPAAGGYNGQRMYYSSGAISGLVGNGAGFAYRQSNITTFGGQSGSPVWVKSGSSRTIYGVHISGSGTSNSVNNATRITQAIFTDFQNWRRSDATPNIQMAGLQQFTRIQASGFGSARWTNWASSRMQDGQTDGTQAVTETVTDVSSAANVIQTVKTSVPTMTTPVINTALPMVSKEAPAAVQTPDLLVGTAPKKNMTPSVATKSNGFDLVQLNGVMVA